MATTRYARRPAASDTPRKDVYTQITDKIVEQLEAGVRPWAKPWQAGHKDGPVTRPLRSIGVPYKGVNVINLWLTAEIKGFVSPYWMTYNQANELGGHVKKGEHGSLVVYADHFDRNKGECEPNSDVKNDQVWFMRGYTVFCADQCEGLPPHFYAAPAGPPLPESERIAQAEAFFQTIGADIRHGGGMAGYFPPADYITMPDFAAFRSGEAYYSTLSHEYVHWTKKVGRCDRSYDDHKRWGDSGYAREELVAEIGAAFLAADLGIELEVREDHAAYIQAWLKVLRGDRKAIFAAASAAQKAVEYLHGAAGVAEILCPGSTAPG